MSTVSAAAVRIVGRVAVHRASHYPESLCDDRTSENLSQVSVFVYFGNNTRKQKKQTNINGTQLNVIPPIQIIRNSSYLIEVLLRSFMGIITAYYWDNVGGVATIKNACTQNKLIVRAVFMY